MVEIRVEYVGDLHCVATHGPSGSQITTDAPVDNQGKGELFSPTDLVATAMGTCMATLMGIVAKRHDWDLRGTTVTVNKVMVSQPTRRIGSLEVVIRVAGEHDEKARNALEAAALGCPVHRSLHPDVARPVRFEWAGTPASA
jgi:putative redox protein